jgi:hypothetical protein
MVAQHDGALAGDYTPATRWQPGLALERSHPVTLPADLAPGEYVLLAGVYEPGRADAPLRAAGHDEARIPIGVLLVLPP